MGRIAQVIQDAWHTTELPHGSVIAIGNFDGVHLGQQEILAQVVRRAAELGVTAGAVTFEPHPLAVLDTAAMPSRLTTPEQKLDLLSQQGIERLFVIRFDAGFSRVEAPGFVRRFLVDGLAVNEVYVGSRFVFGYRRGGDLQLLQAMGSECGFQAVGVAEVEADGAPVSSTRIRTALAAGRVEEAQMLLGRSHALQGVVARGQGRGKGLGWPTINIVDTGQMLPKSGVYTTCARFVDEADWRPSVTNVGRRPTFDPLLSPRVESHVLDYNQEVYGQRVELRFLTRLRDERRFDGPQQLSRQIGRDVAAAREYFGRSPC